MSIKTWFTIFVCATITCNVQAGLGRDPLPDAVQPIAAAAVAAPSSVPSPGVVQTAATPETQLTEIVSGTPVMETRHLLHHRRLGLFAAFGSGDGNVLTSALGADYHFNVGWTIGTHGRVSPYSEILFSYWEGDKGHTGISSLFETGADMFLRYRYLSHPAADLQPYVDLGVGLHYLSEMAIENKELGSHFQVGSNIGIGLTFPRDERYEIGLRIRHLSNGGTASSNGGSDQILGRVGIRF